MVTTPVENVADGIYAVQLWEEHEIRPCSWELEAVHFCWIGTMTFGLGISL